MGQLAGDATPAHPAAAQGDGWIEQTLTARHAGGVQVSASCQGVVLVAAATGSDVAGQPMTPQLRVPIGCAAVPLLAASVAALWEGGRLDLDAPIGTYLGPIASDVARLVTARNLLTHTSGLRRSVNGFSRGLSWADLKESIATLGLEDDWTPGRRARYDPWVSSVLLAWLLEEVEGKPYWDVVDATVLAPLELTDTSFRTDATARAAISHAGQHDSMLPSPLFSTWEPVVPSLACVSTADDLRRFYEAVLPGPSTGWLAAPTRDAIVAHQRVRIVDEEWFDNVGFGLGFQLDLFRNFDRRFSERAFGHSGVWTCFALADPVHDLVVAMTFTNMATDRDHRDRVSKIVSATLDDLGVPPARKARLADIRRDRPSYQVTLSDQRIRDYLGGLGASEPSDPARCTVHLPDHDVWLSVAGRGTLHVAERGGSPTAEASIAVSRAAIDSYASSRADRRDPWNGMPRPNSGTIAP